jgi:hypothetical protein
MPTKRLGQIRPNGQGVLYAWRPFRPLMLLQKEGAVRWRRRAAGSLESVWCRTAS